MKKYLFALFQFSAFLSFCDGLYSVEKSVIFTGASVSLYTTYTSVGDFTNDFFNAQLYYANTFHAVRVYSDSGTVYAVDSSPSSSQTINSAVYSLDSHKYIPYGACPILRAIDTFVFRAIREGYVVDQSGVNTNSSGLVLFRHLGSSGAFDFYNVRSLPVLSQMLVSTNDVFKARSLSFLSSISSSLDLIGANSSASLTLLNLVNSNLVDVVSSLSSFRNSAVSDDYYYQLLDFAGSYMNNKVYDALPLNYGSDSLYADSVRGVSPILSSLLSSRLFLADAAIRAQTDSGSTPSTSDINHLINSPAHSLQALASYSYATPLTNALQGLDGEWKEKVKDTLQDVHDDITNRLDKKTWAGYVDKTTNALDSISRDSSSAAAAASDISDLLKDTQTGDGIRVKLPPGPYNVNVMNWPSDLKISLNKDSLDFMSETVGTIASKWDTWFGYWSSWNNDFYYPSLREQSGFFYNVTNQLNRLLTVSNVLDDILVSITNLDLDLSVTNSSSYMLLSDYADYINSSGLSDLLDVLDDDVYSDFKAEVDSLGHSDVAGGYGRWWRYFTGLSTVQANSIFKLSNIFQAHEKLLVDLKRDNTDVSDLSDGSVFRDILSKIPSQTDIDNKLSQLTNSIDSSGMARLQSLIPDLTNSLSNVSDLYNKDFSLPTDISWVLIPADSSLHIKERVIHINPYEYRRVFDVLHYGIAFAYCIVNILLLPKFLLFLVHLFDRVWNKSEKLIYNSTQS